MEAVNTNPEMEEISILGSQDLLLPQHDSERKLKFEYFIVPHLTAKKAEKFVKVLNHLSYFYKRFFFADNEVLPVSIDM